MQCRLSDLRRKEVVDLQNGEKLGFVDDIELEPDTATLLSLVLLGRERLWGLLRREPDLIIPFEQIRLIGKDTILVALTRELSESKTEPTKSGGFVYKYSSREGVLPLEKGGKI